MTPSDVWTWTAAVLAFAAAVLAAPPRRGVLWVRRSARSGVADADAGAPGGDAGDDVLGRHRLLVAVAAGSAPVLLLGGPVGAVAGVILAVVVHRTLGGREPPHERRRREELSRALPQVVDLLGVALAAGAAPSTALAVVAEAVDGAASRELDSVRHALDLGRDPVRVWRDLARRPGLAALGRTMARAVETGSAVSEALHRLAEDLRAASRSEAEARARAVGVKVAAPLGLCLLPAFVLVGVVPLVAAAADSLLSR